MGSSWKRGAPAAGGGGSFELLAFVAQYVANVDCFNAPTIGLTSSSSSVSNVRSITSSPSSFLMSMGTSWSKLSVWGMGFGVVVSQGSDFIMSTENGLHKSWIAWSRPSSPISCLYLSKDEMACH